GHMDAADDRRRWLSAAVFGNRAAADVIRAIVELTRADNDWITTRMVARHAGLGDSVVRPVMLRLQSAGTLTARPRDQGPRTGPPYQPYATVDHHQRSSTSALTSVAATSAWWFSAWQARCANCRASPDTSSPRSSSE